MTPEMCLTTEQASTIRQADHKHFGEGTGLWLFGSRLDDHARGGDIDLLIDVVRAPENRYSRQPV